MSEASFYEDRPKSETKKAVQDIESGTSAEVVVALRRSAADYRDASYLFGFLVALASLLVMLFAEYAFALVAFPGGMIASFLVGTYVAARIAPVRRLLTRRSERLRAVQAAARAAFVDLGVSRTQGRTGILVFVSMFEREVEIVSDIGVDAAGLGEDWTRAVVALRGALRPAPSFDRFAERLRALAPPLAAALPRAADDVNELPDEVAE
jgi:putative membrane protein